MLPSGLQKLVDHLWELGAIKIDTRPDGGFKLKSGGTSPIYLNLRVPDNDGPLDQYAVDEIAKLLHQAITASGIQFDYFCGLPRAGEPFADALERLLDPAEHRKLIMYKVGRDEFRRIAGFRSGQDIREGAVILLLDDLITKADSKLEGIKAAQAAGLEVSDFVVLLDRQQGGSKMLYDLGYHLWNLTTLDEVLEYLEESGSLGLQDAAIIRDYLRAS